jgi:4-carboxymuconolactone decarboxylase
MIEEQPRLAYPAEMGVEAQQLLSYGIQDEMGRPLNVFRMLAHNPGVLSAFMRLGSAFLNKGVLPPREREIVILRVGRQCGSEYEFGQHTTIGARVGLSEDEIATLATDSGAGVAWTGREAMLIALADEICSTDRLSVESFAALSTEWSPSELVELVVLVGYYRLVSGFLNTFEVPLDPGTPGWPASYTSPT